MTLEELHTKRREAGARYAAAVAVLKETWTELAALDGALKNRNINLHWEDVRTFVRREDTHEPFVQNGLVHPEFAPDAMRGVEEAALNQSALFIRRFTPPEAA